MEQQLVDHPKKKSKLEAREIKAKHSFVAPNCDTHFVKNVGANKCLFKYSETDHNIKITLRYMSHIFQTICFPDFAGLLIYSDRRNLYLS